MATTRGLYEAVTKNIVAELERGVRPWTKGWKEGKSVRIPINASTGRLYSGCNILLLWANAIEKNYPSMQYLTFKQANGLGGHVKKGEKSATVVYTAVREVEDSDTVTLRPFAKTYSVFNVAQVASLPERFYVTPDPLPDDVKLNGVKHLLATSSIMVHFGSPQPCYVPSLDRVEMPNYEDFKTKDDFVSTLGHELIHATGHPSRLNRKFNSKDFKAAYAHEELVAELGSAFLCAHFAYSYMEAQSPAYLDGWLKVLNADSRAIFSIASYASRAADWLRNREPEAQDPMISTQYAKGQQSG